MGLLGVCAMWRGPADVASEHQQRRAVRFGHAPAQARLDGVQVVCHFAQDLDVPSIALEALDDVVGAREVGGPVDRDVVVVEDVNETAQPEVACERGGLVAHALHQVTVAADHEDVVIDRLRPEFRAQEALGDGHADAVGEALAQRPRRDLDARERVDFRVTGSAGPPLAELLDVFDVEPVAVEEQHRVQQDRRVPVGQDEPVAIGPLGPVGVVTQHSREQDVGKGCQRHRRARVTAVRALEQRPSRGHGRR